MNEKYKTYLGKRGYILVKKYFTDEKIKEIKRELTVLPFINEDYGGKPEPFEVYSENANKLYIPRYYGLEKIGIPDVNRIPAGQKINLEFQGSLRENQIKPVDTCLECFKNKKMRSSGILQLPTGFGKTSCALYLLSQLGQKTLIVVHKEFLLNQWLERIQQFLPKARVGIIQQDKTNIEDKDIVIAMLQSISMKEYPLDTFDSFGFVIIDECHHISSKVFSRSLRKINSVYMLGLSATPNRKDGLTKVFKWYLGDIIYSINHQDTSQVYVERLIIRSDNEHYKEEKTNYLGNPMITTMITNIVENLNRSRVIVEWIIKLLEEERNILVLSDRRKHLEDLYNLCLQKGIKSIGYFVGGMKQSDLDVSIEKKVILATSSIASEAMDVPKLDTLILSTPKSDIVQSVGRILRKKHVERPAKIIDVVDNFSHVFVGQSQKRVKLYRTRGWVINDYKVWDELDENGKIKMEICENKNDEMRPKKINTNSFLFNM